MTNPDFEQVYDNFIGVETTPDSQDSDVVWHQFKDTKLQKYDKINYLVLFQIGLVMFLAMLYFATRFLQSPVRHFILSIFLGGLVYLSLRIVLSKISFYLVLMATLIIVIVYDIVWPVVSQEIVYYDFQRFLWYLPLIMLLTLMDVFFAESQN